MCESYTGDTRKETCRWRVSRGIDDEPHEPCRTHTPWLVSPRPLYGHAHGRHARARLLSFHALPVSLACRCMSDAHGQSVCWLWLPVRRSTSLPPPCLWGVVGPAFV